MFKKSSSSLYPELPEVLQSNPDSETLFQKPTSSSSLYPSLDNDEEVPIAQTSSITSQPSIEESIAGEDDELARNYNNDRVDYGLTIASKGQDHLLKEFDEILEKCSNFDVREIKASEVGEDVQETSPLLEAKKEMMKDTSAAYLTTLAPNVKDYNGSVARAIAFGSGSLIKGILWCGDVTADRLQLGHEFLRRRMVPCSEEMQLHPTTLQVIKSAKSITKMLDQVTKGYFPEVLGFSTSAVVNSSVGKMYFSHFPGEIVLASLDGFNRVFDAVEVAGKNVMSTTSTVTTGLVSHRYGEQAAGATNEGLDAAGHVIGIALTIGTAWAFSKIRTALYQNNFVKPITLGKGAAKAVAAGAKWRSK